MRSKMKNVIALLFLLTGFFTSAQDQQTRIKLNKNETVLETVYLGDHGLIFKLGESNRKGEARLLYYSIDGRLTWEKKIQNHYGAQSSNFVVASPTGSVVYNVEIKDNGFTGKIHYITRITQVGDEKKFEVPGNEGFGISLQAVFCDAQYLYYLATLDENERHDKKKALEKVILSRFNNSDFSYKKFVIDLPPIGEGENTTFWSFLGQTMDEKYLVSKNIDLENDKQIFEIAVINAEGTVLRKNELEVDLGDKFTRPAFDVKVPDYGVFRNTDLDFEVKNVTQRVPNAPGSPGASRGQMTTNYQYARPFPSRGAFGHVSFDPATKSIYVYSLFGPKRFKKLGPEYEGFYIHKFDLQGTNLWKLQYKGQKELAAENFFRIHGTPADRDICLKILPDGKLNFSIHFRRSLFSYEISEAGKMISSRHKEPFDGLTDNMIVSSIKDLKSETYIKQNTSLKRTFGTNYIAPAGEILLAFDRENYSIDLIYFRK